MMLHFSDKTQTAVTAGNNQALALEIRDHFKYTIIIIIFNDNYKLNEGNLFDDWSRH